MATGGLPGPPPGELADATAVHLPPQEFHTLLERSGDEAVLLDVRNLYETRIGHFSRVMHSPPCPLFHTTACSSAFEGQRSPSSTW